MSDPAPPAVTDRLRRLEAFKANVEDRLEVIEHQRTTWVPWQSWENLSGRQRELLYLAICVGVYWLAGRWAGRHAAA